ncbi:MAG: general stress protein [Alphaproteobacteria bacterium]|nr:general stress protein [Alphaproteobacteria bacterium]
MTNPYSKDNPGNFANDRERASKAGHKGGEKGGKTTSERYLDEAKRKNKSE